MIQSIRSGLAGLLLLFSICLFAQNTENTGSVSGTVTTADGQPAAYVSLQLKGIRKGALSDDKGHFKFDKVPAGNHEFIVTLVGSTPIHKSIVVIAGQNNSVDLTLTTSSKDLTEVIVSGNRKSYIAEKPSPSLRLNAPLIEVPQNITVATKQTLTDMGLVTKGEIYRISSGITKSYGGSLDMTVQIRGTNATYGTYRNGIGGPIWWNAQEDAAMIERIEFVKGPAGFMLANAEPGGLINTVTKQPTHQRIAEIGFGVGRWNMMRTNIDLGGEFVKEGKLTYRLNAGYQRNNEFYQFGAFDRFFVAPALTYDFSDNTSLTIEHNYVKAQTQENSHQSMSIDGNMSALPTDFAINDPNGKKFFGADVYTRAFLKHKINDRWTFNAQVAHMTTDWDGTTMYLEGISENKDSLYRALSLSDWTGKLTNIQLFLDGRFNTGRNAEHRVLIGIDYGDGTEGNTYGGTWGENKYPISIKEPVYYLPKDTLTFKGDRYSWLASNKWEALYVQDHLKLFNKLVVTLAGRFTRLTTGQDYNNPPDDPAYEVVDNKFTPRVGLTYLFTPNLSAYILHDESFLSQRGAIFGGGRLPPLTGSNNEIGIKALLFRKQLSFTASVYDIKKNDVGSADVIHDGYYLKTGQIRSRGVDIDLAGRINQNFYVNANYSYTDPKITKDTDKSFIGLQNNGTCKNIANIWLKYQLSNGVFKGLGFGAGWQFNDKRSGIYPGYGSEDGNKYLPSYQLFDAALSYTTSRLSINLNAYNLTNKRFASGGSWNVDINEWMFDVGEPFNFRLQTTIRL